MKELTVPFHTVLVDEDAAVVLVAVERMKRQLNCALPDVVLMPFQVVRVVAIPSAKCGMRAADRDALSVESSIFDLQGEQEPVALT